MKKGTSKNKNPRTVYRKIDGIEAKHCTAVFDGVRCPRSYTAAYIDYLLMYPEAHGVGMAEVAQAAKLSYPQLTGWRRGVRRIPLRDLLILQEYVVRQFVKPGSGDQVDRRTGLDPRALVARDAEIWARWMEESAKARSQYKASKRKAAKDLLSKRLLKEMPRVEKVVEEVEAPIQPTITAKHSAGGWGATVNAGDFFIRTWSDRGKPVGVTQAMAVLLRMPEESADALAPTDQLTFNVGYLRGRLSELLDLVHPVQEKPVDLQEGVRIHNS